MIYWLRQDSQAAIGTGFFPVGRYREGVNPFPDFLDTTGILLCREET